MLVICVQIDFYARTRVTPKTERVVVYGAHGWIGGQMTALLESMGIEFAVATARPGVDGDRVVRDELIQVYTCTFVEIYFHVYRSACAKSRDFVDWPYARTRVWHDRLFGGRVLNGYSARTT
jgi:hypothetical protein